MKFNPIPQQGKAELRADPSFLLLFLSGWALAPVLHFVERYVWNDWEFALMLAILITLDTVLGVANAWRRRDVSSQAFKRVILKVLAYSATLVLLHTLASTTLRTHYGTALPEVVQHLDAVAYGAIVVREVLSVHEHLAELGYPLLPKSLLHRLRVWQQRVSEGQGDK